MGPDVPPCPLGKQEDLPRTFHLFAKKSDSTIEDKKKESGTESLAGIASVFVCGLFIITFVVQAFEIPSGSMENTLLVGDHVLWTAFRRP